MSITAKSGAPSATRWKAAPRSAKLPANCRALIAEKMTQRALVHDFARMPGSDALPRRIELSLAGTIGHRRTHRSGERGGVLRRHQRDSSEPPRHFRDTADRACDHRQP